MTNSNKPFIKKAAALGYEMGVDNAPKLLAKGKLEVASKIIEIAMANNIPIKKDPDMVELLSQLELNQEIPNELYKAVAEIFSFIYDISKK
ncbi:EscU/YscU/HrcU family type III secretion system export apparatus switch protein [Arcobacter sp. FWKO B]|uniref:EscU/YscU/HrcU family type III secretion system export apparatus switch protein n=1 Tax=Arcobacter sp. FWKO B TaxID=2593672 RepID=UPI0018A655A3|nr:EscU/YscU/HrcU family type III secretion system export apparatus switch protein [Arcobacter sp. FWKO B]QOG11314.1 type III secretion system protein [Arcobacter sp. FWKO B]